METQKSSRKVRNLKFAKGSQKVRQRFARQCPTKSRRTGVFFSTKRPVTLVSFNESSPRKIDLLKMTLMAPLAIKIGCPYEKRICRDKTILVLAGPATLYSRALKQKLDLLARLGGVESFDYPRTALSLFLSDFRFGSPLVLFLLWKLYLALNLSPTSPEGIVPPKWPRSVPGTRRLDHDIRLSRVAAV